MACLQDLINKAIDWLGRLVESEPILPLNTTEKALQVLLIGVLCGPMYRNWSALLTDELQRLLEKIIVSLMSTRSHLGQELQTHTEAICYTPTGLEEFVRLSQSVHKARTDEESLMKSVEQTRIQFEILRLLQRRLNARLPQLCENWPTEEVERDLLREWREFKSAEQIATKKLEECKDNCLSRSMCQLKEDFINAKKLMVQFAERKFLSVDEDAEKIQSELEEIFDGLESLQMHVRRLLELQTEADVYDRLLNTQLMDNDLPRTRRSRVRIANDKVHEQLEELAACKQKVQTRREAWSILSAAAVLESKLMKSSLLEFEQTKLQDLEHQVQNWLQICGEKGTVDEMLCKTADRLQSLGHLLQALKPVADVNLLKSNPQYWSDVRTVLGLECSCEWTECSVERVVQCGLLVNNTDLLRYWHRAIYWEKSRVKFENLHEEWRSLMINLVRYGREMKRTLAVSSVYSELVEEAPGEKVTDVWEQEFLNPWIVINAHDVLKLAQTLSNQLHIVLQNAPEPTNYQFRTQRPDWMVTASYVLSQCNQLQRMLTQFGFIQDDIICLRLTLNSHACLQDAEVVFSTLRTFYEWIHSCLPAPTSLLEANPSVVSISTTAWIEAMGRQWTQLEQLTAALRSHQHLFDRMTDNARNIYPPLSLLPDMVVRQMIGSWQLLNQKFRSISVFTVGQNTGEKWNMSEHVCDRCVGCDPISSKDGQCEECLREYFLRARLQQWTCSLFPFVKELVMGERQVGARWTVSGFVTQSGENLEFSQPLTSVMCSAPHWFAVFHSSYLRTLMHLISKCLEDAKQTVTGQGFNSVADVPLICLQLAQRLNAWQEMESCLLGHHKTPRLLEGLHGRMLSQLDVLARFLRTADSQSILESHKYKALCSTILEMICAVKCLIDDQSVDRNSFGWLQLFKHRLTVHQDSSTSSVVVCHMRTNHIFNWDFNNQLDANEEFLVPPAPNSRELIVLGSAVATMSPGLLCGPRGSGRRTLVRQLAHLLGCRLIEYSTDKLTTHRNDWSIEIEQERLQSSLMAALLACFRSGSFLLIPDMHLLSPTTLPFLLGELEKLKSCPLATYDGSINLKDVHHKRHSDFSMTSDRFNPLKCSWKTITVSDHSVTIRLGFGLMFTGDQYKISDIPDSLRKRLRIVQMNVPEWTFSVECICANYLPGYRGTRVKSRLKHLLEIAHVPWYPKSSTPTINSILSWPLVCAVMTYAYRRWNRTFRKLVEDRPQKSLQSSLVHREEEDQLAEQAIVYGFIQAWSGPFASCVRPSSIVRRTTLEEERNLSMRAHLLRGFEKFHATGTDRPISNASAKFVYRILQQLSVKGLCVIERQVEKVLELGNLILEKRPILILGSVGSGKSTTLALLAGSINSSTNYFSNVPVRTADTESHSADEDALEKYLDTTMSRSFREWWKRQRFTDPVNCPFQSAGPVKVHQIDAGIHSSTLNLDEPILHDCKEWIFLDLGDSFIPNVNQQILSIVTSLKDPNRRFLLEKTHVDDISPGLLHRLSIFFMDSAIVSWRDRWKTWCQAAIRRFTLPKEEWPALANKMETCLAEGIPGTFQLVTDCYSVDEQQSTIGVHQKQAFEQQCTSNVLSLLDSLLERFFPCDVWDWRKIGHCPPRRYQSVHRRINRYWPSWRRPEDRVEFHSQLIKDFFVFAFIWGVGGRFAGDPRLRRKLQILVCPSTESAQAEAADVLYPQLLVGHLYAESGQPVLIYGPQASGKTQLARAICHRAYTARKKMNPSRLDARRILACTFVRGDEYAKGSGGRQMTKMRGPWMIEDLHVISSGSNSIGWAQQPFYEGIRKRMRFSLTSYPYEQVWFSNQLGNAPPQCASQFLPIMTANDDFNCDERLSLVDLTLTSLGYRFAVVSLMDPTLTLVGNPSAFCEQSIYGFGSLSILSQTIYSYGVSRTAGLLVQRLCWTIWSIHCALMRRPHSANQLNLTWELAVRLASVMGKHLHRLFPCEPAPKLLSDKWKNRIANYSRWGLLLVSETVPSKQSVSAAAVMAVLEALCYEALRLIPMVPRGHEDYQWLETTLRAPIDRYILSSTPNGMLVPIAYLLLGPRGNLFIEVLSEEKPFQNSTRSPRRVPRRRARKRHVTSPDSRKLQIILDDVDTIVSAKTYLVQPRRDCSSWARKRRLNPNLALLSSQPTCISEMTTSMLQMRSECPVLIQHMLIDHSLRKSEKAGEVENPYTRRDCQQLRLEGASAIPTHDATSATLEDWPEADRMMGWLLHALKEPGGRIMFVYKEPDRSGILTSKLHDLIHHVTRRLQMNNPHFVTLGLHERDIDLLGWYDDPVVLDCTTLSGQADVQWKMLTQELVTQFKLADMAMQRRNDSRIAKVFLVLPNKENVISSLCQAVSWHRVIYLTTLDQSPTEPNAVYLNEDKTLNGFLSKQACEPRGLGDQVKQLFVQVHKKMCQENANLQNLSGQQRITLLRSAVDIWKELQNGESTHSVHLSSDQLQQAQRGYQTIKKQVAVETETLEIVKDEQILRQKHWIPQAERNLNEAKEAMDYCQLAVKKGLQLMGKMKRPLETALETARREYERAAERYQAALQRLYTLSVEMLDELRSYPAPPESVKSCIYAICMLFGEEENWSSAKKMMVPTQFISRILGFHRTQLSPYHHAELRRRLALPELSITNMHKVSLAAEEICRWLHALCSCGDALDGVRAEIERLSGQEFEMAQLEADLTQKKLELDAARLGFEAAEHHLQRLLQAAEAHEKYIQETEHKILLTNSILGDLKSVEAEVEEQGELLEQKKTLLPFYNAMAALEAVYLPTVASSERTAVREGFQELGNEARKDCHTSSVQTASTQMESSQAESFAQPSSQCTPLEYIGWLTEDLFPNELLLISCDIDNCPPVLQSTLSLDTMLNCHLPKLPTSVHPITPLVFDPDHLVIELLSSLQLSRYKLTQAYNEAAGTKSSSDSAYEPPCVLRLVDTDFHGRLVNAFDRGLITFVCLDDMSQPTEAEKKQLLQLIAPARLDPVSTRRVRMVLFTSCPQTEANVILYTNWFSEMNPVPMDFALTPWEFAGAVTSAILGVGTNQAKQLEEFKRIRLEEADLAKRIYLSKIHLYRIMSELGNITWSQRENDDGPKKVSLEEIDSCELVGFHVEVTRRTSELKSADLRLDFVRKQRKRIERRYGLQAPYQLDIAGGAGGYIPELRQKVTAIAGLVEAEWATIFRWPCRRICSLVALHCSHSLREALQKETTLCLKLSDQISEIQHLAHTTLFYLIQYFGAMPLRGNQHDRLLFLMKLSLWFARLSRKDGPSTPLEIDWVVRILQAFGEESRRGFLQKTPFEDISLLKELEDTFEDLRGLSESWRTNTDAWRELLEGEVTLLCPLPGVPAETAVCVTHRFLVWITIKPERFQEAVHALIKHEMSSLLKGLVATTPGTFQSMSDRGTELSKQFYSKQKRLNTKFFVILSLVCKAPQGTGCYQDVFRSAQNGLRSKDDKEWNTVHLNVANYAEVDRWTSGIGRNLCNVRTCIFLDNAHIIASPNDFSSTRLWNLFSTILGSINSTRVPTACATSDFQSGFIQNTVHLFLDFSGCANVSDLAKCISRLPEVVRSQWIPVYEDFEEIPMVGEGEEVIDKEDQKLVPGGLKDLLVEVTGYMEQKQSCDLFRRLQHKHARGLRPECQSTNIRDRWKDIEKKLRSLEVMCNTLFPVATMGESPVSGQYHGLFYPQLKCIQSEILHEIRESEDSGENSKFSNWYHFTEQFLSDFASDMQKVHSDLPMIPHISATVVRDLWSVSNWVLSRAPGVVEERRILAKILQKKEILASTVNGIVLESVYLIELFTNPHVKGMEKGARLTPNADRLRAYKIPGLWLTAGKVEEQMFTISTIWVNRWPPMRENFCGTVQLCTGEQYVHLDSNRPQYFISYCLPDYATENPVLLNLDF
ncbi:hypothetical protein CRM22_010082 [Opisthorchis felineus]|uniref:AAA+ ATPase domain-containing protein n=1 Tax=Opisthorchis felineus TaxID=147828 RepID=A0A4S2L2C1_OPIFE|nr:hypothetical protein CRM22_010082 [Opisthorchis felineus]